MTILTTRKERERNRERERKLRRWRDDEKCHCRPGGLRPFRPVLVLRLPFRTSEGERLPASGLLVLVSGCSSEAAGALGDFELIDLMNGKFLNMLLYRSSGLLGGFGVLSDGTAGAGEAGVAGVIAKVAACVRIGELGREGEKLKALEAMEGVVGCDWEREP